MKNLFLLIITIFSLSLYNSVLAFSITGVNPAAVNMVKYNQGRNAQARRNTQTLPYVYSEQQARYYGVRVTNPNAQYRQYGTYKQNYSQNSNYAQRYGYSN